MKSYYSGETPEDAYNEWRKNWTPPVTDIRVRRGLVLCEFGPFGHHGAIWTPERASHNAKVIYDSTGELQRGAEVALEGHDADQFQWEDRTLALVPKNSILMEILE